jgi:hypothetical protein
VLVCKLSSLHRTQRDGGECLSRTNRHSALKTRPRRLRFGRR